MPDSIPGQVPDENINPINEDTNPEAEKPIEKTEESDKNDREKELREMLIDETKNAQEFVKSFSENLKQKNILFDVFQPGFWPSFFEQLNTCLESKNKVYKEFLEGDSGHQYFNDRCRFFLYLAPGEVMITDLSLYLKDKHVLSENDTDLFLKSFPRNLGEYHWGFHEILLNSQENLEDNRKKLISRLKNVDKFKQEIIYRLGQFDNASSRNPFVDIFEERGDLFTENIQLAMREFNNFCDSNPPGNLIGNNLRYWCGVAYGSATSYDKEYFDHQANFGINKDE